MSKIKECFVSRFDGGALIEMDYSQLEVIGLAILSGDAQLKADLKSGIDMHSQNAALLFNNSYANVVNAVGLGLTEWVRKRKIAKVFSFQLQYGSGAQNMADSQGVPKKLAEKFIANYYHQYPGVKSWQENNIETVKRFHEPTGKKSVIGYPVNQGYLCSDTGRTYQFTEFDSPEFMKERGIHTSFSPTQIKNYPVQGFSTGDVVPLAIGELMRYIYMNEVEDEILFVNTIHDSVFFDVDAKVLGKFLIEHLGNLSEIMVSIVDSVNNLWPQIKFDLPLR